MNAWSLNLILSLKFKENGIQNDTFSKIIPDKVDHVKISEKVVISNWSSLEMKAVLKVVFFGREQQQQQKNILN